MIVEFATIVTAIATSAAAYIQYSSVMKNSVLPISATTDRFVNGAYLVSLNVLPRHPVATIVAVEGIGCVLQAPVYSRDEAGGTIVDMPGDHFAGSLTDFNATVLPGANALRCEFWAKPSSNSADHMAICVRTSDSWLNKRSTCTIRNRIRTE